MKRDLSSRQKSNLKLVEILKAMIEKYPDQRFGQILQNDGFVKRVEGEEWKNEFYLEPDDLLKRVLETTKPSGKI